MRKGPPIPVRFEEAEIAFLNALHEQTGLPVADLIRRAVRLLAREVDDRGDPSFILKLISLGTRSDHTAAMRLNEEQEKKKKA